MSVVQVRMKENTLEKLDRLQKLVSSPSRSDTVRRAVEISELIINSVNEGNRIIIENNKGKQKQVLISGVNMK